MVIGITAGRFAINREMMLHIRMPTDQIYQRFYKLTIQIIEFIQEILSVEMQLVQSKV